MADSKTVFVEGWSVHLERQPRYRCPHGDTTILAEPTEAVVAAAVEHHRGVALPTGRERQRAAIAAAVQQIEILPARRGANVWTPERLHITWPDGTTTQGRPLDMRSPWPHPQLPHATQREREAAYQAWWAASWRAVYDRAEATLAGVGLDARA